MKRSAQLYRQFHNYKIIQRMKYLKNMKMFNNISTNKYIL
jgi:hypothetical protein